MSYDPSTHIVSAPVEIADIQSAIGSDSDNLYTLSVNPNINKWAKYKPVQLNQNFVNDQLKADLTWKDDATWWKAQDGKCGLSYLTFGTAALVKAAIDNKTTVWSHVAPTSHVRQTDFNQYDHLAIPPVFNVGSTSARLAAGSTLDILIATST
jgi:hypothetical protein